MRCKKHLQDVTSTIGICASCLRERLKPIVAAQAQAQSDGDNNNNNNRYRKPKSKPKQEPESDPEENPPPPPINFPSSVSPYVTQRKSDRDRRRERMFYGTPQVTAAACDGETKRRSGGRFWNLSNIFRQRSNKTEFTSRGEEPSSSASPPPPSWFSTILHTRRSGCRHTCRQRVNRGLSPSAAAENCCDSSDEAHHRTDSGNSAESSPATQNPTAAAAAAQRRSRLGIGGGGKGVSSMAFCLSPLVRASPNRHWSHKGLAQELGAGGTHHMSNAASFCANRSRKMADFGRVAHNR